MPSHIDHFVFSRRQCYSEFSSCSGISDLPEEVRERERRDREREREREREKRETKKERVSMRERGELESEGVDGESLELIS